jgi:hypothetical protein
MVLLQWKPGKTASGSCTAPGARRFHLIVLDPKGRRRQVGRGNMEGKTDPDTGKYALTLDFVRAHRCGFEQERGRMPERHIRLHNTQLTCIPGLITAVVAFPPPLPLTLPLPLPPSFLFASSRLATARAPAPVSGHSAADRAGFAARHWRFASRAYLWR